MPSDVTVLQAEIDHIDQIAPLFDAYRQFYRQRSDLRQAQEYLTERLSNEEAVIFLAFLGGKAIGFALLYPTFSSVSMAPLWILNDLYIDKEARKQGAGSALLERCKMYAIETNYKGVVLKTETSNITAQRLYERHGWQRNRDFYSFEWYAPGYSSL